MKDNHDDRSAWKRVYPHLRNFFMFFTLVAFVVTCSFLVFFAYIDLSEEEVRTFAPIVFFNVVILSFLFYLFDTIRRKLTVERPTKEIQRVLRRLEKGDFSARVSEKHMGHKEYRFCEIAQNINLLAEELGSIETLRTDFIATVSHELKTPLAVMQNYGTMLQNPNLTVEDRMAYAKAITDVSRRLANLVTNILKLNKLENQQIFPTNVEYDLGEQLCECLLQFESVWESKDIEIETDIEDGVIICSDPELLSLVWNNLISNAMKFTGRGGKVAVSLHSTDETVIVKVLDTGCGMKPEVGTHIFEKFYQGDASHATKGNGLGLALVKRVVDILCGEISVESVWGKGSAFTVKFRKR